MTRPSLQQRRLQAFSVNADDLKRAVHKDRIERIHVATQTSRNADEIFEAMIKRCHRELGEGICVAVTAESGAGKSHLLHRLMRKPALQPSRDEFGPITPALYVQAPSPCDIGSLGRAIYVRLTGQPLASSLKPQEVWRRLLVQLFGQCVSVLVIDEFHHVIANSDQEKRNVVVNTIKSLILPADYPGAVNPSERYPLQVVLAGIPAIHNLIASDTQLQRRAPRIQIDPLPNNARGLKRMGGFITAVEALLGLTEPSHLASFDMVQRFMVASCGYEGRTMHFIKEAAARAIDGGAACIDRTSDLAGIFEDLYGLGPSKNPFLIADIQKCRPVPQQGFGELTLLRGIQSQNDPLGQHGTPT